ncbi:putative tail fibers protein [Escherichia phage vB_EcoM_IME392]|nr:putative tail fibers protein [Escherichia phage vB_EcoM_IME392]
MSLTRLKYLMNEGTDAEVEAYLRQLGIGNGAPLIGVPFPWVHPTKMPDEIFTSMKGMRFLKMNGQTFDPETYPELAKLWTTNQLQDLRAQFIRGWDDGRGMDAGRTINTGQSDSAPEISGWFRTVNTENASIWESITSGFGSGALYGTNTKGQYYRLAGLPMDINATYKYPTVINFLASRSSSVYGRNGTNEIVPKNVAFLYIVRAK